MTAAPTLGSYLCARGPFAHDALYANADDALRTVLDTTHVVVPPGVAEPAKAVSTANLTSLTDLLGLVIERGCRAPSPCQLLSLGFRLPDMRMHDREGWSTIHGVDNYFPNHLVDVVRSDAWGSLLERIGDAWMTFLLGSASLFVRLENGCFFQLCGAPIHAAPDGSVIAASLDASSKRPAEPVSTEEEEKECNPPAKKPRLGMNARRRQAAKRKREAEAAAELSQRQKITEVTPASAETSKRRRRVDLGHVRLLYQRSYLPLRPRFPRGHIFRKALSGKQIAQRVFAVFNADTWDPSRASTARHTSAVNAARFIRSVPMFNSVLRRARRLPLQRLLWRFCPRKVVVPRPAGMRSQAASGETLTTPVETLSPQETAALEMRLVRDYTSHGQVIRFVTAVVRRVVPVALLGSLSNMRRLLGHIATFLRLGRFETLTLDAVMEGIKLSEMTWLRGKRHTSSLAASKADERAARSLLLWIFEDVVIPLVRAHFYVTESSAYRNRLFYFRHDVWSRLTVIGFRKLREANYASVETADVGSILATRKFGFSYLRFLPKENGLRPIVNLRRRQPFKEVAPYLDATVRAQRMAQLRGTMALPAINASLAGAFTVLTYERSRAAELLGASLFGVSDIYSRLKRFAISVRRKPRAGPLYFVSVDVRAAFDTIPPERLLSLLDRILADDEYVIRRHCALYLSGVHGNVKKSYQRTATSAADLTPFPQWAARAARSAHRVIYCDQVVHRMEDRAALLAVLREHLLQNIVKQGNEFWRQSNGIPQGSVLSTLLCNFFYGDMERKHILPALRRVGSRDAHSLLMRFVDDFLLVTDCRVTATTFLDMMTHGIPDYGCTINAAKTRVSASLSPPEDGDADEWFTWCGLRIHTTRLAVRGDYSRLAGMYAGDTLTIDGASRSGEALASRILQFARPKTHPMFCDTDLSDAATVLLNVFESHWLTAIKTVAYMKRARASFHAAFLVATIKRAIGVTLALQMFRARTKRARQERCYCAVPYAQRAWCAYEGICQALEHYRRLPMLEVIAGLRVAQMKLGVDAGMAARLRSVCAHGAPALRQMLI